MMDNREIKALVAEHVMGYVWRRCMVTHGYGGSDVGARYLISPRLARLIWYDRGAWGGSVASTD